MYDQLNSIHIFKLYFLMIRVSIILLYLGLINCQFPSNFMKKIFFFSMHTTSSAHLTNYEL